MKNTQVLTTDLCLFYGLPGTIIFVISILTAIKVGSDFENDTLVRAGIFIGTNALLWFTYLSLFIGQWHRLPVLNRSSESYNRKPDEANQSEIKILTSSLTETDAAENVSSDSETMAMTDDDKVDDRAVNDSQSKNTEEDSSTEDTTREIEESSDAEYISNHKDPDTCDEEFISEEISPGLSLLVVQSLPAAQSNLSGNRSTQIISERYREVLTAYELERVSEKRRLVDSIIEYVCDTMPPFVSAPNLEKLCIEIKNWCENPTYEPNEIELRERLSTNDLCHFIWNIGERLGRCNGYDGECRAKFVKNLFALALSDVEVTSLKNMTKTSSTDRIHLDRPKPNDNSFHYPASTENRMTIEEPVFKVA